MSVVLLCSVGVESLRTSICVEVCMFIVLLRDEGGVRWVLELLGKVDMLEKEHEEVGGKR